MGGLAFGARETRVSHQQAGTRLPDQSRSEARESRSRVYEAERLGHRTCSAHVYGGAHGRVAEPAQLGVYHGLGTVHGRGSSRVGDYGLEQPVYVVGPEAEARIWCPRTRPWTFELRAF